MINIQENVILASYTTFRIGGPAKYFVEIENGEDLAEAFKFAREKEVKFFILGGGSNVLISDQGFSGLVIKINSKLFLPHNFSLGCGAGLPLAKVVREAIDRELSGLEWAIGIPGTIGGAVRGNAGAFGGEIANSIKIVNYIDTEDLYEDSDDKKMVKIKTFNKEQCNFDYRSSIFKQNKNLIILSVVFELKKGSGVEIEKNTQEILEKRRSKQPQGVGSAGSFFINPIVNKPELIKEFEKETGMKSKESKLPAGWLIDQVDLRGKKMGGAMISKEHANFIVNTGTAKAEDVIMLASFVKQQVRDKMGVEMREEIQYVGF
jgi:UDP-N-acetylmuramate dehydrogenase